MNRRSLLRGLLALPLAPLAARVLPESVSEWFLRWPERHQQPTLLDWARGQRDPILPVVEVLSQRNHLLQDVVWHDGNMEPGHHVVMGGPYPEVTFRRVT